jgi:hypothetical protein
MYMEHKRNRYAGLKKLVSTPSWSAGQKSRVMPPLTGRAERYAPRVTGFCSAPHQRQKVSVPKVLELMDGSMHTSLTPNLERGGRP